MLIKYSYKRWSYHWFWFIVFRAEKAKYSFGSLSTNSELQALSTRISYSIMSTICQLFMKLLGKRFKTTALGFTCHPCFDISLSITNISQIRKTIPSISLRVCTHQRYILKTDCNKQNNKLLSGLHHAGVNKEYHVLEESWWWGTRPLHGGLESF